MSAFVLLFFVLGIRAQTCSFMALTGNVVGQCAIPLYCNGASLTSRSGATGCEGAEGAGYRCCVEQMCQSNGICRNADTCAQPIAGGTCGSLPADVSCCTPTNVPTAQSTTTISIVFTPPSSSGHEWYTNYYLLGGIGVGVVFVCVVICSCVACKMRSPKQQYAGVNGQPAPIGGAHNYPQHSNYPAAAVVAGTAMIQMNPDPPYMTPTMHTLHQPLHHSPSVAGGLGSGLSAGIKRDGRSMTSALPPHQEEDAPGLYSFEMNSGTNQQEETGGTYSGAHGTVEMQQGRASFVTVSDPRGSFSGGQAPGLTASFNTINTQAFTGAFDSGASIDGRGGLVRMNTAMDLPSPPTDGGSLY